MLAIRTTTVTILSGTTANGYGDTVDAATVVATGVPASLIEQRQNTTRPVSRRPQTVRYARCRVPNGTPVVVGNRVRDESTQVLWQVDDITQLRNVVYASDIRLNLRRDT
jgi:hypothetical protein